MQPGSLTKQDWLDLALDVLRTQGYAALKAQPLAKKLNVTRGSFYYHFESLEVFQDAVIAHWAARTSGPIIANLGQFRTPQLALLDLLQKTLQSGEGLERAVRSWATVQLDVAHAVQKVDLARMEVTKDLLVKCGILERDASTRARLLYWAAIGRLMMSFPDANRLTAAEIAEVASLMLTMP